MRANSSNRSLANIVDQVHRTQMTTMYCKGNPSTIVNQSLVSKKLHSYQKRVWNRKDKLILKTFRKDPIDIIGSQNFRVESNV